MYVHTVSEHQIIRMFSYFVPMIMIPQKHCGCKRGLVTKARVDDPPRAVAFPLWCMQTFNMHIYMFYRRHVLLKKTFAEADGFFGGLFCLPPHHHRTEYFLCFYGFALKPANWWADAKWFSLLYSLCIWWSACVFEWLRQDWLCDEQLCCSGASLLAAKTSGP